MSVNDLVRDEERPAMVRFERRPIEDKPASREAGQVVYKDVDFVLVTPPFSKDLFEHKVEVWFQNVDINVRNGRTKPEWRDYWHECYEKWKRGEEAPLNGTSVKNWPAITPAQCKTLLVANILTIEDLAIANDEGVRRLGMGGHELKSKAKAYVKAVKDTGPLVMEIAALEKENAIQQGTIASLAEKVDILNQRLESMKGQPLVEVEAISVSDILDKSPTEQYIEKFGKKPHHLMKDETMLKRIAE